MKFHHIGIFVKSLDIGKKYLESSLHIFEFSDVIFDPNIKVQIVFARDEQGLVYELIAPFGDDDPVSGSLKTRKNILNHLAYEVVDIEQTIAELTATGHIQLSSPVPAVAFGGREVCFLLNDLNFIVEIIQQE